GTSNTPASQPIVHLKAEETIQSIEARIAKAFAGKKITPVSQPDLKRASEADEKANFSWLYAASKNFSKEGFLTFLAQARTLVGVNHPPTILGNTIARYDQLTQVEFEKGKGKISPRDIFRTALFIETKIVKTQLVVKRIFTAEET